MNKAMLEQGVRRNLWNQEGRMIFLKGMAFVFCIALAPAAAIAQTPFPHKPVRIMVAYPPGGTTDLLARVLAATLSPLWGQPIVVQNKAGAAGMIGAEEIVRAAPDGHSLLLGFTPEVSINKLLYKDMQYDPLTDLEPIVFLGGSALLLASGPRLGVNSFADLLERKSSGANIFYGSPGIGAQQHLAGELLQLRTGLRLTHVPFKGTGPAVAGLLGGQIDLLFAAIPPLIGHVKAGKLKPLMVTDTQRDAVLPDVPSSRELGLQDFVLSSWFGVFGPRKMDPALIDRIARDTTVVLSERATAKKLEEQGVTLRFLPPAEFRTFIAAEMKKYGDIVTRANVQP